MTTFREAIENTPVEVQTENGMVAYASSLNAHVDLFFQIGALRANPARAVQQFEKAYIEDKQMAVKVLLWARDCRGGAGERNVFRSIMNWLETNDREMLVKLIPHIPFFGRWDDVLVFSPETRFAYVYPLVERALQAGDGLCAKWMPRKGQVASELRTYMRMTPKQYRKTLVGLTKVVEQKMCANEWTEIVYDHVPSVAAGRYQRAFGRHDPAGYLAYKQELTAGVRKINASVSFPYDVLKGLAYGDAQVATAQWDALPNYMEGSSNRILPVVDVSGSMSTPVSNNLTAMDVSVSLGLYSATKQQGAFKDIVITFESTPSLLVLKGTLEQKHRQLLGAPWGGSTDIEAVFTKVLQYAVKHDVPEHEMPTHIVIISDMQFNYAAQNPNDTAYNMITRKYEQAGYVLPKVVFWNVADRGSNIPVTFTERGTALVSGFSPSLYKSIISAQDFSPLNIMLNTVDIDKYSVV